MGKYSKLISQSVHGVLTGAYCGTQGRRSRCGRTQGRRSRSREALTCSHRIPASSIAESTSCEAGAVCTFHWPPLQELLSGRVREKCSHLCGSRTPISSLIHFLALPSLGQLQGSSFYEKEKDDLRLSRNSPARNWIPDLLLPLSVTVGKPLQSLSLRSGR